MTGNEITLKYCYGDDGPAYWARGDISDGAFIAALSKEVDADDPILCAKVRRGYMRYTPDPEREHFILLAFGVPKKRGAWLATWIIS